MKFIFICCTLFLGLTSLILAEEKTEKDPNVQEAFPLTVNVQNILDFGEVYDDTIKEKEFTVTNTSEKDVHFNGIRMNCNCMKILKDVRDVVIKPGEKVEFKVSVNPGLLGGKIIKRNFFLDAEGFSPWSVLVTGNIKESVHVEPAQVIDLESFEGIDVPWTRKYILTNTNTEVKNEDFVLEAPQGARFLTKLTLLEPGKYELEVTPKLPMDEGEFYEIFAMHVKGAPEDKKVRTGITGIVVGRKPAIPAKRLYGLKPVLLEGKEYTEEYPFEIKAIKNRKKNRKWRMTTVLMPVVKDEEADKKANPKGYSERVMKDVSFKGPDNCKPELILKDDQLLLKMTFYPDFLKQETPLPLEIRYLDRKVASIPTGIMLREPRKPRQTRGQLRKIEKPAEQ